ncbi:hypothetical protein E3N88_37402 [Mikania micrantha]|uniref:Uncharacterized protein n=1 Tax=Mikania micrantha TaxID=192012 RepID=A0A5N6LDF5_9ASTR|nr:hypothetical protein E3N88_43947 [Mikania micrantha]KAD2804025.1 hypothetical protein E3N88_37402 [Mikania micrantha]
MLEVEDEHKNYWFLQPHNNLLLQTVDCSSTCTPNYVFQNIDYNQVEFFLTPTNPPTISSFNSLNETFDLGCGSPPFPFSDNGFARNSLILNQSKLLKPLDGGFDRRCRGAEEGFRAVAVWRRSTGRRMEQESKKQKLKKEDSSTGRRWRSPYRRMGGGGALDGGDV